MRAEGSERIEAPPQAVWEQLDDPERLGAALPACQAVDVEGPGRFRAAFRAQTGLGETPVRMTFAVTGRREGEYLRVEGSGGEGEYAVRVVAELDLAAAGQGTEVRWSADVRLYGVLRSLTQRVLPGLVAEQVAAVLGAARHGAAPGGGAISSDRTEAVAGRGADAGDVADPETYEGGPGW